MKNTIIIITIALLFSFSNSYSQENNPAAISSLTASKANDNPAINPSLTACEANTAGIKYIRMTVRNSPALTLQFSGSYNYGVYELSGNDNGDFYGSEFQGGENFGVRHGVGGTLTLKIPLHEKGNIRLDISGMYNNFSSKFSKINTGTNPADFVEYNVYSGEVGIENNFTPNYKFKTLVGAGIVGSVINGKAHVTEEDGVSNLTIIPAFRLGISVYSGLEYMLSNKLGMNFGFKFTHANLWLKQTKESSNPNEIYLNDQRQVPRPEYSGFRQFAWGSFYAGFNVYFGVSPKEYVFRKQ